MLAADAAAAAERRFPAAPGPQEALPMDADPPVAVYGKLLFKTILGNRATKLPLAYEQRRSCLGVSLRKVNLL